jgi:hypothetical protein
VVPQCWHRGHSGGKSAEEMLLPKIHSSDTLRGCKKKTYIVSLQNVVLALSQGIICKTETAILQ